MELVYGIVCEGSLVKTSQQSYTELHAFDMLGLVPGDTVKLVVADGKTLGVWKLKELMFEADYADGFVESEEFDTYIQESYWEANFETSHCLEWMQKEAKAAGVTLLEDGVWDYDKFFFNVYQCTEKGLS